jgi:iron complex outermembrane receptor protein
MTGRRFAMNLLAGASLAICGAAAAPAAAADAPQATELETLVVTASKRAEDIQDVPMSVSAVSGDYLEKSGITSVPELSRFIPSVNIVQSNNNRNTTVFVRGIGTSGTNPGIESSVGIFIDGVYILASGPLQGNLQDIATVEVLRGPQGTLYGRNTPVGAINITSREPTEKFEAMVSARAGNYDDRALSGFIGGGLSENLSARLSAWVSDRDGYETNLSGPEVNDVGQWGLRGRAKWTPNDKLTANFIAYYSRIRSHCCTADTLAPDSPTGIATPGFLAAAAATGHPFRNYDDRDHVVDDDSPGLDVTKVYGASITVDYALPADHTLTSITAFNGYEDDIKNLAADMLPQVTTLGSNQYLRVEGYSEELRIASPAQQRLSYIAGVFLFSESMTYTTRTRLGPDANRVLPGNRAFMEGDQADYYYTQDTRSAAIFGQATFNVTDAFRLNGGLRYSHDKKDSYILSAVSPTASAAARAVFSVNPLGDVSRKESKVTWTAGAQYDIAPRVMVYGLAATGYKTGGFNARSSAPGVPVEFGPEKSITFEAGIKSVLLDRKLILNADVYTMKLEAFQDSILNPLTGSGFIVANAGDRRVRGFEADAQFRPIEYLTLRGSAAYMDAEFTDYPAGQCNGLKTPDGEKPGTCNYNGLTPSQSPDWTWSLVAEWQAPLSETGLEWFVTGDISYTGSKYLEPTLDPRGFEDSVTLVGLRAGLTPPDGRWRVSAYVKNLGDKAYFVQKTTQPLNAFVSGGGFAGASGFVGWYGPPRTYGVEATVRF